MRIAGASQKFKFAFWCSKIVYSTQSRTTEKSPNYSLKACVVEGAPGHINYRVHHAARFSRTERVYDSRPPSAAKSLHRRVPTLSLVLEPRRADLVLLEEGLLNLCGALDLRRRRSGFSLGPHPVEAGGGLHLGRRLRARRRVEGGRRLRPREGRLPQVAPRLLRRGEVRRSVLRAKRLVVARLVLLVLRGGVLVEGGLVCLGREGGEASQREFLLRGESVRVQRANAQFRAHIARVAAVSSGA